MTVSFLLLRPELQPCTACTPDPVLEVAKPTVESRGGDGGGGRGEDADSTYIMMRSDPTKAEH